MRSLFWRIFASFWLVFAVLVGLSLLLGKALNQDTWVLNHHPAIDGLAERWTQLYENRAAQSLGASRAQLIRHVILPSALPEILTGLRIGLGVGWSTLVAAELIAATSGLGFMVQSAAQFLVTDVVLLGILVIALIAFAMEMGLRALQRKLVPWHGQSH